MARVIITHVHGRCYYCERITYVYPHPLTENRDVLACKRCIKEQAPADAKGGRE